MAKILYLSSSTIPSDAANAIQVMRMCEAFVEAGHEVTLIAARGAGQEDFDYYGVRPSFRVEKVWRPKVPLLGQLTYTALALIEARRGQPDLLYARDRLLALLTRRSIPLVFEVHLAPRGARRIIESLLVRRRSLVRLVLISRNLKEEYRRRYPKTEMIVAPSGHHPKERTLPFARPFLSPERLAVGYIGHLYPGKGLEIILPLARQRPDIDFFVAGGEDLQRFDRPDNLTLLEPLRPAEGDAFRAAMDVLIAPYQRRVSARDGVEIVDWMSPLKIVEYMAAGKAILASDLPSIRELLDHNTALLVKPDDLAAWDRALNELLDPTLRARLGQRARRRFEESFTLSGRVSHVLEGVL